MTTITEKNLKFYKENNFTSLLDIANEIENKEEAFHSVVQDLITHQVEKNPKEMNEKEKEIWFTSTLSRLIKINQMLGGVISEIDKIRKDL